MTLLIRILCTLGLTVIYNTTHAQTYQVNDTTLSDHGNPNLVGSIAFALSACAQNGGGTVSVADGTYKVQQGLLLGKDCHLIGEGMEVTTISMETNFDNLITVASGRNSVSANWALENLTLSLPGSSTADFLVTTPLQSNIGSIHNVKAIGGSTTSWGLNLDSVLVLDVDGFIFRGEGNGIIWHNPTGLPFNIGDSVIRNTTIVLGTPGSTGIKMASPLLSPGRSNPYRVNNILLSRVEVQTADGIVRTGTTGIHLVNTARISLIHVDIEHMDTGLLQESAVDGGAVATGNAFMQVFTIGCNASYVETGTPPQHQVVIGGSGDISDLQRLPSSTVFAGHPILGSNRVMTAVRPIEAYTDASTPRQLAVEDAGKVFTNKNAGGTITFSLPPANLSNSIEYEFHGATAGQRIRIQPAAGDLIRPGQHQVSKYYESDIAWGQVLKIRNIDGTIWSVLNIQGNWTSEP